MTQHRRYFCIPLIVVLLSASLFSLAAHGAGLTHSVTLRPDQVVVTSQDGRAVVRAVDGNYDVLFDEGLPELPFRVVSFILPPNEVVDRVEFTGGGAIVLQTGIDVRLASAQVAEDGSTGRGTPLVERAGDVYPPVQGRYLGTGYLHGYTIANIAVFPVQTDGDRLLLEQEITIEIHTKPGEPEVELALRERRIDGFRSKVRDQLETMVANPQDADRYQFAEVKVDKPKAGGFQPTSYPSLEGSPVDYVIITNDSLAAAYQTLADWKTAKGVPTVIRTTEWIEANYRNGVDIQETIRRFVQDAYAKWGITYVLIGGDSEQVPPRLGGSFYLGAKTLPVDMYFACLDGDWNADHDEHFGEGGSVDNTDLYAEVYVGRMPTPNGAVVDLLTSKLIAYESSTDSDFAEKYMFLAEVLYPITWKHGQPVGMNGAMYAENVFNQSLASDPALDVTRMYETDYYYPGSVAESRAAAIDSLNSGYNFVTHIGHGFRFNMSVGDASILNGDADVLTNGTRYGNYYLLNCTGVAYTYFCLAEHFLLCPTGGAVTVVGANESAFPITSSLYMYEYNDLLFNQDVVHIGETFARSRLVRTWLAEIADNGDLYTHYIYTLLGDPEMAQWTSTLQDLAVTHVSTVGTGTTSIQVDVDAVGGGAVEGALVCLSKGTDDYEYGTTNSSGRVTFDFRAESAGDINVVVTALNSVRYNGAISVTAPGGAYVSLDGITVDDDNLGGTVGNGDGVIDAGETVDLWLEMVNSGPAASGNVDVEVISGDPGVTISDATASVGVVGGNGGTQTAGRSTWWLTKTLRRRGTTSSRRWSTRRRCLW
jgi:hypothetical protein